ncbi:Thiol-disulfide isomerase or thioredoxin [Salegentibacter holothuriorum]|uniref:Thiol-disulfide isomerase or thioredoxin n=1 Tax=Salegentibacter holothuriorum TaxID=241145 RepID=A0A1T5DFN8_9FLAO|nr:TlpA disulfide reductase family protein [Salegentibacter holothuriorum]SKB70558.1 Thiol-disulfide isomerase or thioredoxin [Salegentibacter holothuriorum]
MKKLILLVLLISISCKKEKSKNTYSYDNPKTVTLTGKISNFDPADPNITFAVNRVGVKRIALDSKIDSTGHFSTSFKSYTPTDVWVNPGMNFLVLTHPGDSIHMSFDAKTPERVPILKSIQFSGDAVATNQDAAHFQEMYFSNEIYTDWDAKKNSKKEYGVDDYQKYLDTLQQKSTDLLRRFAEKYSPNEETLLWAKTYIEQDYYNALYFYPQAHRVSNNLPITWDVPETYYDSLKKRLPITKPMLLSGYALMNFVNRYHYGYASTKTWNEKSNEKYRTKFGMAGGAKELDSVKIYGIIKHTQDSLLRQLVLAEVFRQEFEEAEIGLYERYRDLVDVHITEAFIAEPLEEHYKETKQRIASPKLATEALLKETAGTSVDKLIEDLLATHKGKVIYADTWAPWCAPCLGEFPNSKKLMEEMEGQDVVFIYFCVQSNKKAYKATLDKYQLAGEHYFLDQNQSRDFMAAFGISGIPYYLLIDKEGTIVEQGSHLRPYVAKAKIEKLL